MSDTAAYSADVTLPGGVTIVARVYVPKGAEVYDDGAGFTRVVQAGVAHMLEQITVPGSRFEPWPGTVADLNPRCTFQHYFGHEDEATVCALDAGHAGDHARGARRWQTA